MLAENYSFRPTSRFGQKTFKINSVWAYYCAGFLGSVSSGPFSHGSLPYLGKVETSAAPTDDHAPAVSTTMGCIQCGTGVALQITGGEEGTGITGSMHGLSEP
jgi:hypothetical protein